VTAKPAIPARLAPAQTRVGTSIPAAKAGIGVRHAWFLSLIIILELLLAGCSGSITHEVCGTVLSAEGSVTNEQRSGPSRPLDLNSKLCAGTIIRTSSASTARIACLSNALVQLSEKTALEIDSLTLRKDGNETEDEMEARAVKCRLLTGAVHISHRGSEGVAEFVAATPHGILTAKFNCMVRLAVDGKTTRITCASGDVTFQPADGHPAFLVKAGFVSEWPSDAPAVVAAADSAAYQQELVEALDVEQRLGALAKDRRSAMPWKAD
jgi:hypothetical protein